MKAVVYEAPRKFEYWDVDSPRIQSTDCATPNNVFRASRIDRAVVLVRSEAVLLGSLNSEMRGQGVTVTLGGVLGPRDVE